MSEVNIEIYSDSHRNEVCDLILAIQRHEFGIPITLDLQPDLKKIGTFYQINKGNFWVAKIYNRIVGTIALLDIGDQRAALRKMFVAKEYRGKELGVGQKLLTNLISWSRQKGLAEIFLGTTEKFVRAQRFYEKNGFIEIPKKDLPVTFPVMEVDVKFYRFSL